MFHTNIRAPSAEHARLDSSTPQERKELPLHLEEFLPDESLDTLRVEDEERRRSRASENTPFDSGCSTVAVNRRKRGSEASSTIVSH